MKTNIIYSARTAGLAVLMLAGTLSALADESPAASDKTASGTITSLDAGRKVVKVRGYLFSKGFVLGDNCALALDDKSAASLGDFRPGQMVTVSYQDTDGVLVADRITQDRLFFTGEVTAADAKKHVLSVRHEGWVKNFALPADCAITLNGHGNGALQDIQPGCRVAVLYETPNGKWTARAIDLPSQHFTGTLGAIDLQNGIVNASKPLLGSKEFHLADGCAIFINGKLNHRVKDLHPGENCELSYEVVNGINIVNRIAPVMAVQATATAQQTAGAATHPPAGY